MNWTLATTLPTEDRQIVVWTKNNRAMVMEGKHLDKWRVDKYSITHWSYVEGPKPPGELLDWVDCDDNYLSPNICK